MTVMANPTEPLQNVLSPRLCPECGQLMAPQGSELANAIAASFANGIRQLMAPEAPGHRPGHAHGHSHGRHAHAGHRRGRGRCDCGCGGRGHEDCGRHGRTHGWHGHGWHEHDWPGREHEHHWPEREHDCCRHGGKGDWQRCECWACDDDCRACEDDPCECRCCIPRCDVLIYARSGETRVLPIVIENHRHRQREIRLHISDWKTFGDGSADVTTVDLEPASFDLKACGHQTAQLRISIGGKERQPPETCTVACADLTVGGCDMKPMRIAVAILPLECGPYRIDCSCGCC